MAGSSSLQSSTSSAGTMLLLGLADVPLERPVSPWNSTPHPLGGKVLFGCVVGNKSSSVRKRTAVAPEENVSWPL